MKKIFLSIGLVVLYLLAGAQQKMLTLQQCVETALTNNLDVLQSQLQMESTKIDKSQAKLNLLPSLNANAGQTFSQGRSIDPYSNTPVTQNVSSSDYGANTGVVLFNGLSLQNLIKQYSLNYRSFKNGLATSERQSYLECHTWLPASAKHRRSVNTVKKPGYTFR